MPDHDSGGTPAADPDRLARMRSSLGLRAMRALAEATEPMTAANLADATGYTDNATLALMRIATELGLVSIHRLAAGRGRPPKAWSLTEAGQVLAATLPEPARPRPTRGTARADLIRRIMADHDDGIPVPDLAEKYRQPPSNIRRWLGLSRPPRQGRPAILPVPMSTLIEEYEAGDPLIALADRHGLAYNHIRELFHAAAVPLRKGTAPKGSAGFRATVNQGERAAICRIVDEAARLGVEIPPRITTLCAGWSTEQPSGDGRA